MSEDAALGRFYLFQRHDDVLYEFMMLCLCRSKSLVASSATSRQVGVELERARSQSEANLFGRWRTRVRILEAQFLAMLVSLSSDALLLLPIFPREFGVDQWAAGEGGGGDFPGLLL